MTITFSINQLTNNSIKRQKSGRTTNVIFYSLHIACLAALQLKATVVDLQWYKTEKAANPHIWEDWITVFYCIIDSNDDQNTVVAAGWFPFLYLPGQQGGAVVRQSSLKQLHFKLSNSKEEELISLYISTKLSFTEAK